VTGETQVSSRPPLPEPRRERWQPLRLGLVELFHYDSEEFWFHDGHLLLRGNNGTGKSKVLALTLPLLLDAQLRPSRVEPDGDSGKKMAWNLLVGSYPRRIGYSWIEFGRRDRDGKPHFLTLGVGLSAVDGRAHVDPWYFLLEGDAGAPGPRVGQDLWLTTSSRQVLTRDRLREEIAGRGQLFETAPAYRRAVDERLFGLGTRRYDALMDTLIQLRQPQLSKKPDETGLSNALSESLPPLPVELLGDVADALNQLEEDRNRLEEARRLQQVVTQFEQRYRVYAGTLARRQARELRQAQTGFDNASEARNRAQEALEHGREAEAAAIRALDGARQAATVARERVETLQSDPRNQDANRLVQAQHDAQQRAHALVAATERRDAARTRLAREIALSGQRSQLADQARVALSAARASTREAATVSGVDAELLANPLFALEVDVIAETPFDPQPGTEALRALVARRRRDIALLRQRHADVDRRHAALTTADEHARALRGELDEAVEHRGRADSRAEQEAAALVAAWSRFGTDLVELCFDSAAPLAQLAEWAARPEGDNPAAVALTGAWQSASNRYAARAAELDARRGDLQQRRAELAVERERLAGGEDTVPPQPTTRAPGAREQRPGAPLWQLVDFRPHLGPDECAGVEAALEATGLLDAWLAPDGSLTDDEGRRLLDANWTLREPVAGVSLNEVLVPTLPDRCAVTEGTLTALLAGVACAALDVPTAEAWISPTGSYRLGALAGAWSKPEALYIGRTARERARQRRLQEIAAVLVELDLAAGTLDGQFEALEAQRRRAELEWRGAPSDRPLQESIAAAASAGGEVNRAQQRLDQAEIRHREAEAAWQAADERLRRDATDLHLPFEPERLPGIDQAIDDFDQAQARLTQAASDWRRDWSAHREQQGREGDAREMQLQAEDALAQAGVQAEQARVRFEVLTQSVGQKVDALLQSLREARDAQARAEADFEHLTEDRRNKGERRAVAETEAQQKELVLAERIAERLGAADRLQRFVASGLLTSALPGLALPEAWSIDPALNLARRIEHELRQTADDDDRWTRVQRQIAVDLTDLQRALSALGHQAVSEPNDWGFSVHILYQNRTERPDALAALLADDVAQRSELLSAREREVLENHLQAEIAAEIQRLMRAAADRVAAINEELRKRPTTTGVRYRLKWEPLSPDDGAPAGLDVARERLLNTSADLWSVDDRRAVGSMLQRQIAAERARADADVLGSSLSDQLARALDYRHWHRFRIERQQDGLWRKLSGPASSGERALGLTVPLFAAVASFYAHGGSPLAPRLILLDEAFAGIDDSARAHCMGLIREFDLDFVITSEREWACYAELPGVAICQLQRREGIDAVFVSRWTWDGRARCVVDDPDRRFPPA
jgi:uncharacterized protein (TIGR02680 family)